MKIFFATWLYEPTQAEALTVQKASNRLISFYHTREHKQLVPHYIETGLVKKIEKLKKKTDKKKK